MHTKVFTAFVKFSTILVIIKINLHSTFKYFKHIMLYRAFFILFIFVFSFGVFGFQQTNMWQNKENIQNLIKERSWVDSVINTMTLEEKIGQFFTASVYTNKDNTHKQEIYSLIKEHHVGGLLFFKGHPTTQANWVNGFQQSSKIPLMVSIDGEWGINMRLDSTIKYPRQLTLGAIQDNQLIYKMGKRIAEECRAVGITVNLAPVLDVNNNPDNPVINDRSFGEDKFNVALKGLAYTHGMQDANVMAVGKHFPGHGDTNADSHKTLPVINHNIERLNNVELYPFKTLFANNMMGVMAAHLHIPALDDRENRAVSLSKKVTTYLLKDSLGFKGLVFSDALNMKGVSAFFAPGEVDKEAFLAGNDILLFSEDIPRGISLIKKAVTDNVISESYIDERLRKVLSSKFKLDLTETTLISTQNLNKYLTDSEGLNIQKQLFEKAITLVSNKEKLVPLDWNKNPKTASLSIGKSTSSGLLKTISAYGKVDAFSTSNYSLEKLSKYDQVIIPVFSMSRYSSKNYGFSESELKIIKDIEAKTKVILVLFGSPYSLKYFNDFENIIVAYEENNITEMAVANILVGNLGVSGKLPVSSGDFTSGMGLELVSSEKMKYISPKDLNIKTGYLEKIDSIMNAAIKGEATPGGQILIAKAGQIFYNKAFGYFDYEKKQKVTPSSIYDVASITKVAATTLSIMRLQEQGKIELKKTIGDYLPEFKSTDIADVNLESILLHQSGLPGWIPFYMRTMKDSLYGKWYQTRPNEEFCIQVADNMYMCADSTGVIWDIIGRQGVKENPKYRYSDIGFYILRRIIENVSKQPIEKYVDEQFYKPLGLNHTTYLPLKKFAKNQIVPSEDDKYFRNQRIQGHVHDMGAAMLGGVSGHAGIFSNTQDLAVILQMLLNKGYYNGVRFFKPETIAYFTSPKYIDNRRGLGFDKPVRERDGSGPTSDLCSFETYGHSGFTGCVMWADPKYDLIYVFLSNRTFPTMDNKKLISKNVRTNIQDAIYNAIGVKSESVN